MFSIDIVVEGGRQLSLGICTVLKKQQECVPQNSYKPNLDVSFLYYYYYYYYYCSERWFDV
jgi:hypothetical protein